MSRPVFLLSVLFMLALGACASGTKVTADYREKRPADAPYTKILVVGITPNQGLRVRWEQTMQETITRKPYGNQANAAWGSFKVMGYETPMNRETIGEAMRKVGAQAVLVSQLVRQDVQAEEVEARSETKIQRRDGTLFDFFTYEYEEVDEPSYTMLASNVEISTDLYEATDGRLIYSMNSITYKATGEWTVRDEATAALVKRLRKDGMIR